MEEKISHEGIVQKVSKNKITVTIVSASACSACHANGACNMAEMQEKEVDIHHFRGEFHAGQLVNIVGKAKQGYKAAFYGYLLPFILVFVTLIIAGIFIKSEGVTGILSLAILIPYYIGLYFFRNKLKNSFEFEIYPTT